MASEKRCEACDGWALPDAHHLPAHQRDAFGKEYLRLCSTCYMQCYEDLLPRVRRRASRSEPVVSDRHGRELKVGDTVSTCGGPAPVLSLHENGDITIGGLSGTPLRVQANIYDRHSAAPPEAGGGDAKAMFGEPPQRPCVTVEQAEEILRKESAPTLAAFADSVEQYLLPLLPGRFRCVTDAIGCDLSKETGWLFVCFILDEHGLEAHVFQATRPLLDWEGPSIAGELAKKLFARSSRGSVLAERGRRS